MNSRSYSTKQQCKSSFGIGSLLLYTVLIWGGLTLCDIFITNIRFVENTNLRIARKLNSSYNGKKLWKIGKRYFVTDLNGRKIREIGASNSTNQQSTNSNTQSAEGEIDDPATLQGNEIENFNLIGVECETVDVKCAWCPNYFQLYYSHDLVCKIPVYIGVNYDVYKKIFIAAFPNADIDIESPEFRKENPFMEMLYGSYVNGIIKGIILGSNTQERVDLIKTFPNYLKVECAPIQSNGYDQNGIYGNSSAKYCSKECYKEYR